MVLTKKQVYLSLGTNLGDKLHNLIRAAGLTGQHIGQVIRESRIYQSVPWGYSSAFNYFNQCLLVESTLTANQIITGILKIEKIMGRTRLDTGYTDRLIDIDLLLYGDLVLDQPGLQVPHPRMGVRRFVLEPLAEIAPFAIHPVNGHTILEMLHACNDRSEVNPV